MKTSLATAILVAVTLTMSGCGGGDGSEADAAASKALSDSIVEEQNTSGSPASLLSMTAEDADCIGAGLVKEIGREKLRSYGLLTEDDQAKGKVTEVEMSAADAKAATGVLFDCADVEAMVEKAMAAGGAVAPTMRTCVNNAVTEETLRTLFTQVFQGQPYVARQTLLEPIRKCATGSGG